MLLNFLNPYIQQCFIKTDQTLHHFKASKSLMSSCAITTKFVGYDVNKKSKNLEKKKKKIMKTSRHAHHAVNNGMMHVA